MIISCQGDFKKQVKNWYNFYSIPPRTDEKTNSVYVLYGLQSEG